LKSLGVQRLISISAVGSLKEEFAPLDLVIPDQLIDRTWQRDATFYDQGIVVHIGFADPFCATSSRLVYDAAREMGLNAHSGGAMVVMEGPAFSTRAESAMYRSWGAEIIGMTALPEARLAREAEICYATLALVTDYDTWHETEAQVSVELVVQNLLKNVDMSQRVIRSLVTEIPAERSCGCASALENAIITSPELIGKETRARLSALIGRYMEPHGGVDAQT
jgi:5'-methylthioadenosine phosphorylase